MGNCSLKGGVVAENISDPIRVMMDSGGIMEFSGPIQVGNVVGDFPGHGIFKKGHLSSPLFHHEQLFNGQLYYLLPLKNQNHESTSHESVVNSVGPLNVSSGRASSDIVMSLTTSEPALEVLPSARKGVWRVKLVIDTKQLEEILSEDVNTGALIEKMRSVAAASSTATPRRTKGAWAMNWKPNLRCPLALGTASRPLFS